MGKISEKLRIQLGVEKKSVSTYSSFINRINNASVKKKIAGIIKDEIEHVKSVEEMISLTKKKKLKEKIKEFEEIDLNGFLDTCNSLLVTVGVDKYPNTLISIERKLNLKCIYISFNKISSYIRNLLIEHGVDIKRINFIECVPSKDGKFINPNSLTELSIEITELMNKLKSGFFVVVDTISSFSVYHEEDTILKFVSLINSEVQKCKAGVIWVAIKNEGEKRLNERIGPLCDYVLRL